MLYTVSTQIFGKYNPFWYLAAIVVIAVALIMFFVSVPFWMAIGGGVAAALLMASIETPFSSMMTLYRCPWDPATMT